MRILVTGGTGFVGNNLARALVESGERVGLLTRPGSRVNWRLVDLLSQVDIVEGDVTEPNLDKIISDYLPDFIFHLAAYGAYPRFQRDTQQITNVNVIGGANIALVAKRNQIPLVNCGSSSEYGVKNKPINEDDECSPELEYGKAKLSQTQFCQRLGFPTLRLFSVYGPWEDPTRLMPALMRGKLKGERLSLVNSVREYAYIEDISHGFIRALKNSDSIKGQVINIGQGLQYSMEEVLEELDSIDKTPLDVSWNFPPAQTEPQVWVADISKAKRLLNYQPTHSLRQGLEKTYDWWKSFYDAQQNES
jgi:nucleoside-diphosphate-sugar epimerase